MPASYLAYLPSRKCTRNYNSLDDTSREVEYCIRVIRVVYAGKWCFGQSFDYEYLYLCERKNSCVFPVIVS